VNVEENSSLSETESY